jgi:NADPH:quinone reductase-like Zn-dependent oxidoreductase
VGQFACQILKLAGYKTIIATAPAKHHEYLQSLGVTHTFDYSSPILTDEVIRAIGGKVSSALDCIATEGTFANLSKLIKSDGLVAVLLCIKWGYSMNVTDPSQLMHELPTEILSRTASRL